MLLEPTSDLPLRTVNVTCWEWAGTARDEGDAAALWLSEYLGKPVRLVRYMGASLPYPTNPCLLHKAGARSACCV